MKLPYGIADFYKLITEDYFYADRTPFIPRIEDAGAQLLFLRPRRFGKSLLLSTLENYYDLAKADEFERLFGRLVIGRNPTPKHNQYFVLKWDFSAVNPHGEPQEVARALHEHINDCIAQFGRHYQAWLPYPIELNAGNAISSFQHLLAAIQSTPHRLYLLIDEYDNFANEILMGGQPASQQRYAALLMGEGALKTVFKTVKAAATGWGLDRVFITGVSPVVLSDMTSGYNVAKNIYLLPQFHELCGLTETEVSEALTRVAAECSLPVDAAPHALTQMRLFYNGYRFSDANQPLIYNPTLALYFLDYFQQRCAYPDNLLDENLAMDRNKLAYIARLPGGPELITQALNDDAAISVTTLANRFSVEDMLTVQPDAAFMVSLLYYFGVLTLAGRGALGKLRLQIPNLVMRKLYAERLQALLLPTPRAHDEGLRAAEMLYLTGELQPLCDFVEQRYFTVFSNRDYLHANELTIKTVFLTLLFNDVLYIVDSETTVGRRYADITLIVRPHMRQYQAWDVLLEFKFVKLSDAGLSGEAARQMKADELRALLPVQTKLAEARTQTPAYRRDLTARYGHELRLRAYAVIALGFERLVWEELGETAGA